MMAPVSNGDVSLHRIEETAWTQQTADGDENWSAVG
jgi:hypothetical protein